MEGSRFSSTNVPSKASRESTMSWLMRILTRAVT